jgi:hypothetical protein
MKIFQIMYQWYTVGTNVLHNCWHKQHIKKAMSFFLLCIFFTGLQTEKISLHFVFQSVTFKVTIAFHFQNTTVNDNTYSMQCFCMEIPFQRAAKSVRNNF